MVFSGKNSKKDYVSIKCSNKNMNDEKNETTVSKGLVITLGGRSRVS